jgi:hypothetical protein
MSPRPEVLGMCERRGWEAILAEASLRQGYMHGPAILYQDLLRPAITAVRLKGAFKNLNTITSLGPTPALQCH